MKKRGIPTSVHYPSLLSEQNALNNSYSNKNNFLQNIFSKKLYKNFDLKNAKKVSSNVLSLPMHPYLSEENQDLVINSLIESISQ